MLHGGEVRGCGGRREVWKDEHTKEGYCGRHQAFHLIICHAWIRTYALVPIFDKGCTVPRNSQRHPARPNAPSNLRRPTAMRFPSAPLIWEPLKRRAVRRASSFLVYHEEIQTCAVVNQCQHFRIGREREHLPQLEVKTRFRRNLIKTYTEVDP